MKDQQYSTLTVAQEAAELNKRKEQESGPVTKRKMTPMECLLLTGKAPRLDQVTVLTPDHWSKEDASQLLDAGVSKGDLQAMYGFANVGSFYYRLEKDGLHKRLTREEQSKNRVARRKVKPVTADAVKVESAVKVETKKQEEAGAGVKTETGQINKPEPSMQAVDIQPPDIIQAAKEGLFADFVAPVAPLTGNPLSDKPGRAAGKIPIAGDDKRDICKEPWKLKDPGNIIKLTHIGIGLAKQINDPNTAARRLTVSGGLYEQLEGRMRVLEVTLSRENTFPDQDRHDETRDALAEVAKLAMIGIWIYDETPKDGGANE